MCFPRQPIASVADEFAKSGGFPTSALELQPAVRMVLNSVSPSTPLKIGEHLHGYPPWRSISWLIDRRGPIIHGFALANINIRLHTHGGRCSNLL